MQNIYNAMSLTLQFSLQQEFIFLKFERDGTKHGFPFRKPYGGRIERILSMVIRSIECFGSLDGFT
ncbi:hypothetical protein WT37_04370 [Burkholderia territorii]|nr:hypothetical protein WT37_04370 [Burkholderia territorii]